MGYGPESRSHPDIRCPGSDDALLHLDERSRARARWYRGLLGLVPAPRQRSRSGVVEDIHFRLAHGHIIIEAGHVSCIRGSDPYIFASFSSIGCESTYCSPGNLSTKVFPGAFSISTAVVDRVGAPLIPFHTARLSSQSACWGVRSGSTVRQHQSENGQRYVPGTQHRERLRALAVSPHARSGICDVG